MRFADFKSHLFSYIDEMGNIMICTDAVALQLLSLWSSGTPNLLFHKHAVSRSEVLVK